MLFIISKVKQNVSYKRGHRVCHGKGVTEFVMEKGSQWLLGERVTEGKGHMAKVSPHMSRSQGKVSCSLPR